MVNLDKHRYPFWSIDSLRPLSVWPSIDSMSPSGRCHFVVRNGRIRWIANDRALTEQSRTRGAQGKLGR